MEQKKEIVNCPKCSKPAEESLTYIDGEHELIPFYICRSGCTGSKTYGDPALILIDGTKRPFEFLVTKNGEIKELFLDVRRMCL
jgi:hypothetical protein